MTRQFFAILFLLTLAISGNAQIQPDRQTVNTRYVAWAGLYVQYNFSPAWSLASEAQARYEYTDADWITNLVRAGLSWKMKNGLQLTGGFAFFKLYNNPNSAQVRTELRPWQEAGRKFTFKKHVIYPRFRFEQRFIQPHGPSVDEGYSFSTFRERFRVDYTYFFNPDADKTFLLLAGEEYMINTDKKGKNHFDQNRFQLGFGYRFNKNLTLQLAYLHLFLRKTEMTFEQHHTARLSVVLRFSKKEKTKE